ncbi:hypothetical protein DOY81_010656, partial [Sarcophaga bullata]
SKFISACLPVAYTQDTVIVHVNVGDGGTNCGRGSVDSHIAFSALDDTSHSVHIYSINGTSLGSKYVSGRVT